jgi:AcrR family transcriptional regulator
LSQRPRGRPRSFDTGTALKAAAERFRTHGFAGTSLDELAAATGLNRPSLYAAFGDKRALYLAALADLHAALTRAFDAIAAADLPLPELLERIFDRTITGYLKGEKGAAGCLAISTAATEAVADPAVRQALSDILTLEDERLALLLERAGSPDPAAHGRIVTSVLHSLSVRARAGAPREALDQLANDCIALVLASAGR